MEELLKELEKLSEQKNLFPAERIVLLKLFDFESKIPKELESSKCQKIIEILSNLLRINVGKLSPQCSIRIGDLIYYVFAQSKQKSSLFDVINSLTENPTQASIYAAGCIVSHAKPDSDTLLNSFLSTLLIQPFELILPTLFALSSCFGHSNAVVEEFTLPAFNLAKQAINIAKEDVQLMAEKLVLKLCLSKSINMNELVDFVGLIFLKETSIFVTETGCKIYARALVRSIDPNDEEKTLKDALALVMKFPQYKEITFLHFISLISHDLVSRMYPIISGFIVDYVPNFLNMFTNALTKEARKDLFSVFEKAKENTVDVLNCVQNLDYDENSKFNVAALAYDLAACDNEKLRAGGAAYFCSLYSKNRQLAIRFLRSSLLFLAAPPDDYPKYARNIRAKALIASNIISSVDCKEHVLKGCEDDINKFLNRAFETNEMLRGEFGAAFVLMSSLPEEFIPLEDVYDALGRFRKFFKETEVTTPKMRKGALYLGAAIAVFIAAHPIISKTDKTIRLLLTNKSLISPTTKLAAFLAFPHIQAAPSMLHVISSRIHGEIMTINPKLEYMQYRIKTPMSSKTELLHGSVFKMPRFPSAFVTFCEEDMTIRIVEKYAEYIKHIPKDAVQGEIAFLFMEETSKTVSSIYINALLSNKDTAGILPKETLSYLLKQLSEQQNVTRIQLIAESISLWCVYHREAIDEVLSFIANWRNHTKCLTYAALFTNSPLSEPQLLQMMLDMNNLAKSTDTCPFALFALSALYNSHFQELANLNFTNSQCFFLLDIMQSPLSLIPFNLYYMSRVFISLLPILSADLETTRSDIIPVLALILQTFANTKVSFSKQVLCMTARTANQLAPKLLNFIHFDFPDTKYKSFAEKLNILGVFSDLINFGLCNENYFQHVPEALVLLQMTNDSRAFDFVISVAHQFGTTPDISSQESINQLNKWLALIKNVLADSYFPVSAENVHLYAMQSSKKCMLIVARVFIQLIQKSTDEKQKKEWLKTIIDSVIKPISAHNQELFSDAFNVLITVIDSNCAPGFESELATAAEKGFGSLDQCGLFHVKFLDYLVPKLQSDEETYAPMFKRFVSGIDRVEAVPASFLSIASKIISLARSSDTARAAMKLYFDQLLDILSSKLSDVMDLMDKHKTSNKEIGALYYSWGNFMSDFVWLETITRPAITPDIILSFCVDELKRSTEQWRIKAAANGIKSVIENMSVDDDLFKETVESFMEAKQLNEKGNEKVFAEISKLLSERRKK